MGFSAEGFRCVGFDIEQHVYGDEKYPGELVLQDVRTISGKQFAGAACIVASPPCQAYSYMAMPWTRAKKIREEYESGVRSVAELTALFDACFRIQREACEAAGRYIPMVVENVKGAQSWVGRAKWHYGSYYLWGDVPALMPEHYRCRGCGEQFEVALGKYGCTGACGSATKQPGLAGDSWFDKGAAAVSSRSPARKAASARIAKIPFELARHIARVYKP